jgi:hypothetical protein
MSGDAVAAGAMAACERCGAVTRHAPAKDKAWMCAACTFAHLRGPDSAPCDRCRELDGRGLPLGHVECALALLEEEVGP